MSTPAAQLRSLAREALDQTIGHRRRALAVLARKCLALTWTEYPSNRGPFIDTVMRDSAGLPWCAGFALHMSGLVGLSVPGGFWRNRSVHNLWGNASKAGITLQARVLPEPGDLRVQYGRGLSDNPSRPYVRRISHIGVVERVDRSTFEVFTIDGNWSNDLRTRRIQPDNPTTTGYIRLRDA